jgi:hypothetical protein
MGPPILAGIYKVYLYYRIMHKLELNMYELKNNEYFNGRMKKADFYNSVAFVYMLIMFALYKVIV